MINLVGENLSFDGLLFKGFIKIWKQFRSNQKYVTKNNKKIVFSVFFQRNLNNRPKIDELGMNCQGTDVLYKNKIFCVD